tara:strand:- start:767 stop:1045 length:279 start_codon:yes stop_codon:yes gene_type:complete
MGLKLSDVSPLASMIEGRGIAEYMGVIPRAITQHRGRRKERKEEERLAADQAEKQRMEKIMSGSTTMSAGGKTRTKPIDGIAIKGKTRGRMI